MQTPFDGFKLRTYSLGKCRTSRSVSRLRIRYSISKGTEKRNVKRVPDLKRQFARLGLPSKGRMAEDTLKLLQDCQLSVYRPNPRQYVASIPQVPGVEAWFQRATDVVRKLRYGDMDLGIVGYDMYREISEEDSNLIMIHDSLNFGRCHLALGVPMSGIYSEVQTLDDLRTMELWTERRPLRVATGYSNIARKFFKENKFEHVVLLGGDGALEAAPAMGSADIILDLVSTGITLRENNLREITGGRILDSEGVLVGNKESLLGRPGLLRIVKELIERFDAHLKAKKYFSVISNMRGASEEIVAKKLIESEELSGLQGPTISPVYTSGGKQDEIFATVICVKKKNLYKAVHELRQLGGSGVLVQPMTYIFDEEPIRWRNLLKQLGKSDSDCI